MRYFFILLSLSFFLSSAKAVEKSESNTILSSSSQISVTLKNKTGDPLSNLQIQVVNKRGLNIGEIRTFKGTKVLRNVFSSDLNGLTLLNYKEISFSVNCDLPFVAVENFFFPPLNLKSSNDPHFLKFSFDQSGVSERETLFYPLCGAKESIPLEIGGAPFEKGFLKKLSSLDQER